jgi:hypothetical protein
MTWEERGMASDGVEINGPKGDRFDRFYPRGGSPVAGLHRELALRRTELLAARAARQQELSAGGRRPPAATRPSAMTPRRSRPGPGPGGPAGQSPARPTGR